MNGNMEQENGAESRHKRIGLIIGIVGCALLLALPAPPGMGAEAWRTAAVAFLMAAWWASEAIPVPATALAPLVLFPLLGVADIRGAAAPFANPLIYLFFGGFLIALGMERWNLHRRIALAVIARIGTRPAALVPGFMIATAFLSMWVSNTATTMMMMPIAVSVIGVIAAETRGRGPDERNFATALMLGIAYAASIGGLGTLIGTPPNAFLAAFMAETYDTEIAFVQWMAFGLPVVGLMLPVCWLVLTRYAYPFDLAADQDTARYVAETIRDMGPITVPERRVAVIFGLAAGLWMFRPLIVKLPWLSGLSDPGVAIFCGLLLFLIPSGGGGDERLMNWETTRRMPWGVLVLFGGGLSLAAAMSKTGLAAWIGNTVAALGAWPLIGLIVVVAAVVIFLTELTSNTATTAAFLPVVGAVAVGAGYAPMMLVAPAAVAASCAFMLPVATPPNAIVFGTGHVTIGQMMRAGIFLNLAGVLLISLLSYFLLGPVFG